MQVILSFLIFFSSISVLAQTKKDPPKKIALTVGADHEGGAKFVQEQNVHARKMLKDSGYVVKSLFGNEKTAKDFSTDSGSYSRPFTYDNLKKSIEFIYNKPCSERPEQFMLNFVAHGSRNYYDPKTKQSYARHSINGVGADQKSERIYADQIAKLLKQKRSEDSGCDKPKLAIMDYSCKSGASTDVFKGLGCVMTSTGAFSSAHSEYINNAFSHLKDNKGKSLADLHLDLLINQEPKLVNIDYKDGATVLQRIYDDTNQISGCGDEKQVNFAKYSKYQNEEFRPVCQSNIGVLTEKRDKEIETVEEIVSKLKIDSGADKATLAKIAKVDPANIPEPEGLKQKLEELISNDEAEFDKIGPLVTEESKIMSDPALNTPVHCSFASSHSSSRSYYADSARSENLAKTLCKTIYQDERKANKCALSYRSKGMQIAVSDILQFERENKIYGGERKLRKVSYELSKSGKPYGLSARSRSTYDILSSTISNCIKKVEQSGNEAQKNAVSFFKSNYKKVDANCSENTIACHRAKAVERADNIKKILSYARGYAFLSCQAKLKKSDDLKACEDFKI